jgi:protein gp37
MSKFTKIQWCDSTLNPTMGCNGCELWGPAVDKVCYAGILHQRFKGKTKGYSPTFDEITLWPGRMANAVAAWSDLSGCQRLEKPWIPKSSPRLVFLSDMSDSFSREVTFEYLYKEIITPARSAEGRRHKYLWLTKRPGRMAEFSEFLERKGGWPENIWPGTSITSTSTTGRIASLLEVRAKNFFVSLEPQRGRINGLEHYLPKLDWLIQGGESGTAAVPFDLAWARELVEICTGPKMPAYFLKQLGRCPIENGRILKLKDSHGGSWDEWPADIRVRQFPLELIKPESAKAVVTDSVRTRRREAALKAWATRRRRNQQPQDA